jgi:hypothetical protein
MKATELRIGNYLFYSDNVFCEVITNICKTHVRCYVHNDLEDILLDITELKPIPLNNKWLIKLGFEKQYKNEKVYNTKKDRDGCLIHDVFLHYDTEDKDYDLCLNDYFVRSHIKYVHQLQNIYFALTNEELIIK